MAIVEAMHGTTELQQQPAQPAQPGQSAQAAQPELPPNMARAFRLAQEVQQAAQAASQDAAREQLREQIRSEVRAQVQRDVRNALRGEVRPDQIGAMAQDIAERAAEQAAQAAALAAGREGFVLPRGGAIAGTGMRNPRDEIPPQAVQMTYAFFATVLLCVVGLPIARAWARRMDRRSAPPSALPEVSSQLRHLQQSVEAVAIEVERISEAQRYTARMLGEGAAQPVEGRQGERVGAR